MRAILIDPVTRTISESEHNEDIMALKFPNTIKAMQRVEGAQWAIGDALLKDIPVGPDGVNNGAYSQIEAARQEALANGFEYEHETLRRYRETSHRFTPVTRADVSHKVHQICGTPERLNAVLAGWKASRAHQGEEYRPIPLRECTLILKAMREDHLAQTEKAVAALDVRYPAKQQAAQAALDAANAELEAAKDAAAEATTLAARQRAEAIKKQAETNQKQAQTARNKLPNKPQGNPDYIPEPERVHRFIYVEQAARKAETSSRLAKEALADLADLDQYELADNEVGALMEAAQTAVNNWRRVMQTITNQTGRKGAHLQAVSYGPGAARKTHGGPSRQPG
jgi:hypothetical protein